VHNRRLAISAAVVGSLGIALVPALAEAAQTSTAHTSAAATTAKAATSAFSKHKAKQFSLRSNTTTVRPKVGSATTPNPGLGFEYDGYSTSAYGVELDLWELNLTSGSATATVDWGDGSSSSTVTLTTANDVNVEDAPPAVTTHTYASIGTYRITVTIDDGQGDTNSGQATIQTGSLYHAYGPTRILDTRKGLGETSGAKPIAANGRLGLQVTGAGTSGDAIPAGITAVVMNVTATGGTANGALSVYGNQDTDGYPIPASLVTTSNLNYRTGQNIPNLVIVPVGKDGVVDFYNNSKGTVNVIADVAGYFTADGTGDQYVPISPARILDTRKGTGTNGKVAKIPANGSITLTVAGAAGGKIPASDATAVSVNLTAVDSTANGVITAYPAGQTLPTASNINYSTGQTVANLATVPLGTNGQIVIHNTGNAPVDVIGDAAGYYTTDHTAGNASAYVPYTVPYRYLDSRTEDGALDTDEPMGWGFAFDSDESAFVINATVVSPTGNGFLSLYSFDPNNPGAVPTTSNLNYRTGQTVPNLAITAPGTTIDTYFEQLGHPPMYDIGLYLGGSGTSQVLLDEFGEFYTD